MPKIGHIVSEETRKKISIALMGKCYISDEGKKRIGLGNVWKGRHHSEISKQKISDKKRGVKASEETKQKLSLIMIERVKNGTHPNYKGGITPDNKRLRKTPEMKKWVNDIFERDNYTCVECGLRGVHLEAHHIKPFALFPELMFNIDNGITLCQKCHSKTDTYKGRIKNYLLKIKK